MHTHRFQTGKGSYSIVSVADCTARRPGPQAQRRVPPFVGQTESKPETKPRQSSRGAVVGSMWMGVVPLMLLLASDALK